MAACTVTLIKAWGSPTRHFLHVLFAFLNFVSMVSVEKDLLIELYEISAVIVRYWAEWQ